MRVGIDETTGALVELLHKRTGWTIQNRETLADTGARFEMTVSNNSELVVESVCYPYIGDIGLPPNGGSLTRMNTKGVSMSTAPLYPQFANERGYWGVDYPTQMVSTPRAQFVLMQGQEEGVYVGCHDETLWEMVNFTFQLKPGYDKVRRVPKGGEIGGTVSNLDFCAMHLPFAHPGETLDLSPIVIAPYSGSWHGGIDLYSQWRQTWMKKPAVPEWVADLHSWQQIQLTSWGDTLRISYQDLLEYGEECARHGVGAIQLVGWTLYGQDGRLPIHDIDPRLGTRDELGEVIRKIQDMGVKVVLYEKFTCTDKSTDWYKDELHKHASKDVFGNTHGHGGWQYHTPAHLAGVNTRPYAWMCMNSKGWQDVALSEIEKSLDLEPAGILLDEAQVHGDRAFYCFDETHGHRIPAFNFRGDAIFEKRLVELLKSHGEDLVLSGEGPWDLQNRHYILSYIRTSPGHIPVTRYTDPFLPMMNWVYGYDDRENINLCLLYRYLISYEPLNFKGHLEDFPLTLEYGRRVDALRERYKEYLWNAEFRDTVGAEVVPTTPADVIHSVFLRHDGKRAVVIANHDEDEPTTVNVNTEPELRAAVVVTPENPEPVTLNGGEVEIPARSVAVVLEDYE